MPKRAQQEFSDKILAYTLELLSSAADHIFVMVPCPSVGLDWRGFTNIIFTPDEPPDDIVNISVFFLINIVSFYCLT
jgi:hypothetical protein